MERRFKKFTGTEVQGTDGDVGHVRDIYFDDATWRARYFVVETGGWLDRRRVLLSPNAIVPGVWHECLPVRLTREQVRSSPDVDTQRPISRQHEEALNAHYGWPAYWSAGGTLGMMAAPIVAVAGPVAMPTQAEGMPPSRPGDPHLRSVSEVVDYKIAASDGDIGHVEDFLFDDTEWEIRYIMVDTRNWLPGRKVLVSPQWIKRVSWTDGAVHVDLRRDSVEASPEYDPEHELTPDYDERLREHYGHGSSVR
jgi:sporulation protein YlmC with PRC-barrel domain